jgi:aspartate kinase
MNPYVLKYGGTSVETIEQIKSVAAQLVKRKNQGQDLVVVLSAMGQTTDQLLNLASEISDNPDRREVDLLLATGEQVSVALLSIALKALGVDSIALTGSQAGIFTDDVHTKARISRVETDRILRHLAAGEIVVVAGFQGINENGDVTTLGRGGSDTSAVSLAAALGCTCELFTDVDGIYTVDPRILPQARKLKTICYEEMLELASRGAKVIETRAVEFAHKYKVPVIVGLSTGEYPGTLIKELDESMEKRVVTGISVDEDCLMVTVNTVPYESKNIARIFSAISDEHIMIDMISQTAPYNSFVNLTFTSKIPDRFQIKIILEQLKADFPTIDYLIDDSVIKLSVVGIGMVSQSGVASALFNLFAENDIDFYQVTTSEISISYTLNAYDRDKAVQMIASAFDL